MIKLIYTALGMAVLLAINACSESGGTTPTPTPSAEIKPIQLTESRTIYYSRYTDNGLSTSYEHGITFSSNKNGKITQLGGKVPASGNYRMTVWDDSSKAILASTNVALDSLSYKYTAITPVDIIANKKYVVSINVLKAAFYLKDNLNYEFMPMYESGITIHYYNDAKTSAQTFPNRTPNTYKIYGLPDFVFIANQ